MSTGSELFAIGEPAAAAGGRGAAPDFARHDRGDADDNWVHAEGESCARCGAEITAKDFIRRSAGGGWVHEGCPSLAR